MVHLDARGDISVAEIIIYIPILILSGILVLRHGFARRAGWIFLLILSIIRIAGGITHILLEQKPTNTTLQIVVGIFESSGVSPLLLATVGFLNTVCQESLDQEPLIEKGLKLLGALGSVALILTIIGGVKQGDAKTASAISSGAKFKHIGVILFGVLYGLIFLAHVFCWSNSGRLMKYRRMMLKGISAALPFLAIRVAYTILSAYSPLTFGFNSEGDKIAETCSGWLCKFNSTSGSWQVYLFMSVATEYVAVIIYTVVGTRVPLQQDYAGGRNPGGWSSDEELMKYGPGGNVNGGNPYINRV
ncbi:hypothetical protein CERSUDRAFT_110168 [Gelatoporia subvermispora B]|uniref:DUF7702 domain-containing protein n=1 Tax=Ceriporiopsis subvermispora (strain B) TaxID=914234 RepID=M2RRS0_CERS8|nr:hypothetical protein CERSUDRAFT_110168 [Gelatoporia subvermispora B]